MTLDDIVRGRFSGEQIAIKVDVEGYEAEVLRGAAAVLAMIPKPSWIVPGL
jgi:FkbM family methyltransferase